MPHDYIDCTEGRDQFLEDMEKAARGGVDAANEFYLEMDERLGPPPPGAKVCFWELEVGLFAGKLKEAKSDCSLGS